MITKCSKSYRFKNIEQRTFGPKRGEMIGGSRNLHNEEVHSLYSSSIIRMIKSRTIGWACSMNGDRGMNIGYWWQTKKKEAIMKN
jgi:hypothetical protein